MLQIIVVISNRLVNSPCAVVADATGYTANVERLMSELSKFLYLTSVDEMCKDAANNKDKGFMSEFAKKQKILEVNPRSPLIEGLLRRLEQLPTDDEGIDPETESELKEVASILIDSALVRSGFAVPDSNKCVSS